MPHASVAFNLSSSKRLLQYVLTTCLLPAKVHFLPVQTFMVIKTLSDSDSFLCLQVLSPHCSCLTPSQSAEALEALVSPLHCRICAMPKSDMWPGGIAMESLINVDGAGSCDSVVSVNSGSVSGNK